MNYEELKEIEGDIIANSSIIEINSIDDLFDQYYCINDKIPIKIDAISNIYMDGAEIDILDPRGDTIGCICKATRDFTVAIDSFTENRYISYLADISKLDYLSNNYIIKNTYAIIKKEKFYDYLSLAETSPLWGAYYHETPVSQQLQGLQIAIPHITAAENIEYPTDIHRSISVNALLEPFVFERFLKKYHQIELLSDLDIVERIKSLGTDLYGIGQLLSEVDSKELNRLRIILKNRITNVLPIASSLELVMTDESKAFTIFQKYKKSDNPIQSDDEFRKLLSFPDFTEGTLSANLRKNLTGAVYSEFIIHLASFWVYRIRCSIAHKRIGEYIMSNVDEDFMLNFGEPLIDSIIIETFKR